jgi:pyruvate kinase
MRRSKIVATIGPSTNTKSQIKKMIKAGMDVARVNMSHGDHVGHQIVIESIREVSKEAKKTVGILMDLQGPKIRVDQLDNPIELTLGDLYFLGTKKAIGSLEYEKKIFSDYEFIYDDLNVGERVLFDDGKIKAKCVDKKDGYLVIEILNDGVLKPRKGINLPDSVVSADAFTSEDKKNLMFGIKNEVDFFALSFVGNAQDIKNVKNLLHKLKCSQKIVAKIERPAAIKNIDEIIAVSDAIMVARGDMGVELGNHLVPAVQKEIISKCNKVGVPVITATQMLESMMDNPSPTRAEASDVANAIWDGTDAVMLSGESAAGKYPIESIQMMNDIVFEAEKKPKDRPLMRNVDLSSVSASIMVACSLIAEKIKAKRIVCVTQSGNSCLKLTRFRPTTQALGVTNSIKVARRMSLYWGVTPFLVNERNDVEDIEKVVINKIKNKLGLQNGDKLVISRGDGLFFQQGKSNNVRVEIIKDTPKVRGGSDTLVTSEFSTGQINLDTFSCATCYNCISTCPHSIWEKPIDSYGHVTINAIKAEQCTFDMECVEKCPTGAIEILNK